MVDEDGSSPCPPADANKTTEPVYCIMGAPEDGCTGLQVEGLSETSARLGWPDVPNATAYAVLQRFEQEAPMQREPLLPAGTNTTLLDDLAGGVWTFEVQALANATVVASFCGQAHLHAPPPQCAQGAAAATVEGGVLVTWPASAWVKVVVVHDATGHPVQVHELGNATSLSVSADATVAHTFTVTGHTAEDTVEFCPVGVPARAEIPFFPGAWAWVGAAAAVAVVAAMIVRRA